MHDSDIAKYAKTNNYYVITNDTDFFVFDVPGVIYLKWMLEGFSTPRRTHFVEVYPRNNMLRSLRLNNSSKVVAQTPEMAQTPD